MARAYGCLPRTDDARDYRFRAPRPYTGEFVDLTAGFPEPPYDQGNLGSCVANGTVAAVDFARAKQGLAPLKRPSRLFVYYQGRVRGGYPIGEDSGLQIRDGFQVIAKDGAPPEDTDWPYDVARFAERPPATAYTDALLDQAVAYGAITAWDIDRTVASGYPVVFGAALHESFESDHVTRTGVVPMPEWGERYVGGHCMVIVSTRKPGAQIPGAVTSLDYYRVRNSWGTSWADGGYCWLPVPLVEQDASDFWVVTAMEDPHAPTPPGPPPRPEPSPAPAPGDLEAAAHALGADPVVTAWLARHHHGDTRKVAAHVRAVIDAAQGVPGRDMHVHVHLDGPALFEAMRREAQRWQARNGGTGTAL